MTWATISTIREFPWFRRITFKNLPDNKIIRLVYFYRYFFLYNIKKKKIFKIKMFVNISLRVESLSMK